MFKNKILIAIFLSALMVTSCVNDLDVKPMDPDTILAGNLNDNPVYMKQVLGKIYASFIIPGQGANGGADISASDENFLQPCVRFGTFRKLQPMKRFVPGAILEFLI